MSSSQPDPLRLAIELIKSRTPVLMERRPATKAMWSRALSRLNPERSGLGDFGAPEIAVALTEDLQAMVGSRGFFSADDRHSAHVANGQILPAWMQGHDKHHEPVAVSDKSFLPDRWRHEPLSQLRNDFLRAAGSLDDMSKQWSGQALAADAVGTDAAVVAFESQLDKLAAKIAESPDLAAAMTYQTRGRVVLPTIESSEPAFGP